MTMIRTVDMLEPLRSYPFGRGPMALAFRYGVLLSIGHDQPNIGRFGYVNLMGYIRILVVS